MDGQGSGDVVWLDGEVGCSPYGPGWWLGCVCGAFAGVGGGHGDGRSGLKEEVGVHVGCEGAGGIIEDGLSEGCIGLGRGSLDWSAPVEDQCASRDDNYEAYCKKNRAG